MLYICTKFHENISEGFRVTGLTQFLISKFSKRHRSVENIGGAMILISTHFLIMFYICTKCHENISQGFRVMEGLDFQYSKFSKGHNSVKNVGRSIWSLLSAYLLIMLHICTKFHENI